MLLNVMWQLGWEGSLGENGYMYMHGWVSLSSIWNYHNIVNRLCACVCSVAKSCLTPCDPMDCSPPGYTPIKNKKFFKKCSLAFISTLSYLFSQTHVQEMGCSLPLPAGSTGWNSPLRPSWADGGNCLDEACVLWRTVMGNGAIKADWGQPGEESERGRKKRPPSARCPAPPHLSHSAPA